MSPMFVFWNSKPSKQELLTLRWYHKWIRSLMILDWENKAVWKTISSTTCFFWFILECPKLARCKVAWNQTWWTCFSPKKLKDLYSHNSRCEYLYVWIYTCINMFMLVYILYLCTYVDTIQWYICIDALLALIFCGRTHTHQTLVAFRLQTSTSSWWRRMRWSRLVFWPRAGADHMSGVLEKHPEHLKRGIPSEFDAYLWTQNISILLRIIVVFTVHFFLHWMDANITGRRLRWELVSHCWLPSLCCWLPPAIGGLPHWVSSVAWKHWKKKQIPKDYPRKWTHVRQKRDHLKKEITSSNPWFFTGYSCVLWGERPCPETKSWNEQLLHMETFELGRG